MVKPFEHVERSVVIPRPATEVWPALAEAQRLSAWLAPEVDVEVVAGAIGSVTLPDGQVRRVRVEVVDAPRRLVFRWRTMEAGAVSTGVELTLTPVPEGTVVRVVESTGIGGTGTGTSLTVPRTVLLASA